MLYTTYTASILYDYTIQEIHKYSRYFRCMMICNCIFVDNQYRFIVCVYIFTFKEKFTM